MCKPIEVETANDYIVRRSLSFDPAVERRVARKILSERTQDGEWLVEHTRWKYQNDRLLVREIVLVTTTSSRRLGGGGKGVVALEESQAGLSKRATGEDLEKQRAAEEQLSSTSSSALQLAEAEAKIVYAHWTNLSTRKLTESDRTRVMTLLGEGFAADELCLALDRAAAMVIPHRKNPQLKTVLRDGKRTRELLGEPKAPRVTWLTPYERIWQSVYGEKSKPPFGLLSKVLPDLIAAYGDTDVQSEFAAFCQATPMNYMNVNKFPGGYGKWKVARVADRRAVDLLPSDTPSKAMVF